MVRDARARRDGSAQPLRVRARTDGGGLTPAAAPVAVTARSWGWRHAGRSAWAVRGLDLDIEPGERVLLLGASGSGKSTLLQALAGVLGGADEGEEEGTLLLSGEPAASLRGRAGLVLQDPDSQLVLSRVGDDVAFGCENLGVPRDEIWRRVAEALDAVGLDVPLDRSTHALSGGQKQRLALAGVLAMRPGLLLLDEPTANLDPRGVAEVREAVARVLDRTGATAVVVEHRTAIWRDLVDRVVVLQPGGGVAVSGAPASVLVDHGAELAASGVWIPGHPPALPLRRAGDSGAVLIEAHDVAVGRSDPPVARSISTGVTQGRVLAVEGPNGAGKTTLGLTLAGLIPPLGGSVRATTALAGPLRSEPIRWTSRDLASRIGSVFQHPEHQFVANTVHDELAIGTRVRGMGRGAADARIDELLERLRLAALARANPFTLSGGEKRRLSVATALAASPRVLVLDEPTFGQDSRTWVELVALVGELADEGTAIVAVTHDAEFVAGLADDRLVLGAAAETRAR